MLIAFTGKKQSGKDTSANIIQDIHPEYERMRFAGPLKEMIATLLREMGMDEEQVWDHIDGSQKEVPLKLLQGKSVRYAMQTLGTEWRNFFGPDLWSDIIAERIDSALSEDSTADGVIITDMRFEHEDEFVKARKGYRVRTRRYGQITGPDSHPSEVEMEKIVPDMTLYNYGSLADFETIVILSMGVWMGRLANLIEANDLADDLLGA